MLAVDLDVFLSFCLCVCISSSVALSLSPLVFVAVVVFSASQLEGLSQEERDMMSVMGFAGFDSTKVCNK